MKIRFVDFEMDESVVAPVIYDEVPHQATNRGVVLPPEVRVEIGCFLSRFNNFLTVERPPYYRIDAYFDENSLWILELNASFVDGWGVALNLARAAGIAIDPKALVFPNQFAVRDAVYRPELELFVRELAVLGLTGRSILGPDRNDGELTYVYGRVGSKDQLCTLPYDGLRLDDKLNLGLFARQWDGELVRVPRHYVSRFEDWEEVPQETVLKFCDKGSAECERAGQSVIFGKPNGKARFLKRCYREERLIAQDFVKPARQGSSSCQLVILAIGDEPVAGYVQYSWGWRRIINDDSTHGPLRIS
ncbi:hypothetical protein A2116_02330 [Candidatus Jorgensenbacteria bacterium GWA1_49_17]|uniref:Uncharacterized protein n=2 Tax=Candidatus Joergenseniibacteriota TaxID=1752739 RepID=A0A1F6BM28_9BACT|nr:MAG: hypothetical protein A2127_02225 [Candidatus Jorgensenbacteria bacterium GWC1_48_12]OGG40503.1 MAG: hypothetical protein A2116_02330 [Candidatus Jorgensenbacteria bacterium GWA1_49_17]